MSRKEKKMNYIPKTEQEKEYIDQLSKLVKNHQTRKQRTIIMSKKQKEEQRQKRLEVAYINIKHLQYLKALYERYDISENNYRLLDDEESEECLMIIDVDNEIWNRKLEKTRELVEKAQHRNKIAMELQEYLNQRLGDNLVIYNTWKHDDIFYTIIAERHKTTFLVNESIAMVSAEQYNKEDEEELEDEQRQTQRQ